MHAGRTAQEILDEYKRFRILSVGRSGAGKSSLINCVFNIDDAKVSHSKPGEAEIYSEITSESNQRFVLHDSKGFEPSTRDTFDIVQRFIVDKSTEGLELKERLHTAWLCIRTPFSSSRVLETGDEEFLKLAYERNIPVMIVFTHYDTFVNSIEEECDNCKSCEICDKCQNTEPCEKRQGVETCDNCKKAAKDTYDGYVQTLAGAATRLGIPTPECINVSVRDGYTENILDLVAKTEELVEDHLWLLWATAQRVSLPSKMRACVSQAMTHYSRALLATSTTPAVGPQLLCHRLVQVHKDIIACMNFRDTAGALKSEEFKQLLLAVVQDMENESDTKSPPIDTEKIAHVVELCTTALGALASPAAILGLSYLFLKWISNAVCDNVPKVQRVFIAYAVDLTLVLRELFDRALLPDKTGSVTWDDLREAFEAYDRTPSRAGVHGEVTKLVKKHGGLTAAPAGIHTAVEELLRRHSGVDVMEPV
ncbi:hypothetical protein C8J57DRAFT_1303523 [Mycena rebaudengoi]|nr:hypothetical protein C8J57DRAFT_1303523 [Mycena rebaudengoi]